MIHVGDVIDSLKSTLLIIYEETKVYISLMIFLVLLITCIINNKSYNERQGEGKLLLILGSNKTINSYKTVFESLSLSAIFLSSSFAFSILVVKVIGLVLG